MDKLNIDWKAIETMSGTQIKQMLELLEPKSLKYSPHMPTPKQQVFMNLTTREAFFGGAAGGGKQMSLDTEIYTASGWKLLKDIHTGDILYDKDGLPTTVLVEYPVDNKPRSYKITLDDSTELVACADHKWTVSTLVDVQRNGGRLRVMTTQEMVDSGLFVRNKTGRASQGCIEGRQYNSSKYRIPVAKALAGVETQLPIHPYLLGYWLGDGARNSTVIATSDLEVVEYIRGLGYEVNKNSSDEHQYGWYVRNILPEMRSLNLQGQYIDKFIPEIYLQASYEQRLELLRGLMDSDGTVEKNGVVYFCNTEKSLVDSVSFLLRSLGYKHTSSWVAPCEATKRANYQSKNLYEREWRLHFTPRVGESPFRLTRKSSRLKNTRNSSNDWYFIKSIEPIESVPMKCLTVDSPSHTFLVTKSLVPTHNSDALLMDALQYSDTKGYAAIIFRKSFADLTKPGALIDRAKEWLLPFPNVVWKEKDRKFEFQQKYGRHTEIISILQFGYLESEDDRYNYQGGEYQYAGFDELVHMSEANYRYIFSRLRRLKGTNVPIRMRGASNPPDDGQGQWVYDRFVNPETRNTNTIFIPAGMDDNPYLDKDEYSAMLDELDPVTRARLKDGVWTIVRKGNMFKEDFFGTTEELPKGRRIVRFWDMAATDPEKAKKKSKNGDPDWTVGAKVSEYKGIYIIEDIERFRKDPGDTQRRQKEIAAMDGKRVKIRMEQEPGSSGIISIQHYMDNVFKGYNFKGVKTSGSKVERANPVSAKAEHGKIFILQGCKNREEFFKEAESFPGGAHDDIVDAISGAIAELSTTAPKLTQMPEAVGHTESYWDSLNNYYG